ncbi:hypothetical protein QCA50_016169 [Cerrena zonata]|uniref:Uncharacterized protein n=1 Tax=Cerrena zonata TaxID=2478898 RepID=A0AAW0FRJ5_9APHY
MEGNSRAGPSSEPTTVPLSPGASSSSRVHDDNVSSCGSVESEDEGYEELYAELKSAESKGKGVDRNFVAPRAETETSRPRAQDAPSKSGSWSDLNLSLVVALVSPIGNWLTGQ